MENAKILIVDDDEMLRQMLTIYLEQLNYNVVCAHNGQEALAQLASAPVNLVVSDLMMPEMDGIQLMHLAKELYPLLPFIMLSGQGSIEGVVKAISQGAFDFLEKPINFDKFNVSIKRALMFGRLAGENAQFREHFSERFSFHNIVTRATSMRKVLELAERVTTSPLTTVSLSGESGCGKEVLARAIHFESGCLPSNFVAVNCAAIPEALLESELFGHVRGAFTGAERDREGKFEVARNGTLLLDEIGDMHLSLQAKLLRVLEERTYEKVGSNISLPVDFRVIVATHRDLQALVQKGVFREDLYHRINVIPIEIPPLRERIEDIPLLVDHYLNLSRKHQGKELPGVAKKAMDILKAYSWPGNIRELRNVLEYATILVSDELIRAEHLRFHFAHSTTNSHGTGMNEYHINLSTEDLSLSAITDKVLEITLQCVFRSNPATVPVGIRPPFRRESGRHSDLIPATIPEQSGQCNMRV